MLMVYELYVFFLCLASFQSNPCVAVTTYRIFSGKFICVENLAVFLPIAGSYGGWIRINRRACEVSATCLF